MKMHFDSYRFLSVLVLVVTPLVTLANIANSTSDNSITPSDNISTANHRASLSSPTSFHDESVFESGTMGLGGFYQQSHGGVEVLLASYLGSLHNQAFAFEFNGGTDLFRENVTYGLALTDQQRIKMTYERLDEKQDFGFGLAGTETRWMGQNAFGGDYAYLLSSAWLERIGFGGYVTHSRSKNLSDGEYRIGDRLYLVHRRISGATSVNAHSDTAVRLWPQSRLSGGLDYDSVHFNTRYNTHNADTHGFGGHVQIEQRVLPQVKLSANSHLQTNEQSYGGNLGWLLPTRWPMELVAKTDYINNKATKAHFWRGGLRMNVGLSSDRVNSSREYPSLSASARQSLLNWTRTPVVRMSTVLTTADYPVYSSSDTDVAPPSNEFSTFWLAENNFGIGVGQQLGDTRWFVDDVIGSPTRKDTQFKYIVFDNVNNIMRAFYVDEVATEVGSVVLIRHNVIGVVGSNWEKNGNGLYQCNNPNYVSSSASTDDTNSCPIIVSE